MNVRRIAVYRRIRRSSLQLGANQLSLRGPQGKLCIWLIAVDSTINIVLCIIIIIIIIIITIIIIVIIITEL